MKVLVISGFLGAGKTTFIKELIQRTSKQIAVLENEYGETDLDSRDISQSGSTDILELTEGCVCCSQKDTFANSLITIQASVDPEYLVVEPTGVAKLGNILANVQRVEWEKIKLLKPIVILSPRSYYSNMSTFEDICTDQIQNASYIVLSKLEFCTLEEKTDVINKIKAINPDAQIIDTPYKDLNTDFFNQLLESESTQKAIESIDIFDAPLDEVTLKYVEMPSVGRLVRLLEDTIHGKLGEIVRAKGTIKCCDKWLRYDCADGLYSIIENIDDAPKTQCVFIGYEINQEKINDYFIQNTPKKIRFFKK